MVGELSYKSHCQIDVGNILNGELIRGSPFTFEIQPGPVVAESCRAIGVGGQQLEANKVSAGGTYKFWIETRDKHGVRRRCEEVDTWRVWLQGPARIEGTVSLNVKHGLQVSFEVQDDVIQS